MDKGGWALAESIRECAKVQPSHGAPRVVGERKKKKESTGDGKKSADDVVAWENGYEASGWRQHSGLVTRRCEEGGNMASRWSQWARFWSKVVIGVRETMRWLSDNATVLVLSGGAEAWWLRELKKWKNHKARDKTKT
ncbi:hypothetical protein Salat_2125200 [Sesamum alatum]|uniref:Uncharacterized protein n=1 Tax=Sesamum alatum TaxID=300844 RepID=A0AAE2CGU5_9LAMI|nr:hypothetical protein Salat_2125200 [Sesamum alatum]